MIKRCIVCGMSFSHSLRSNVCSDECRKARREMMRIAYKSRPKVSKKKKSIIGKSIAEINALARKEGLTYGECVARCSDG